MFDRQITSSAAANPRVGMLATVRNRRALIASVEPFDGSLTGRLHLVTLEYTDPDGIPEETVIWEREISPSVLEPTALPQVATEPPMLAADFDAMQRSTRWTALSPFLPPDRSLSDWTPPVASPFFGAVQVEDFQLVPLLKALRMPRISLLLADDVGLGKTVEAGLILTELLLRRRIRRVLILCPATLRKQWQQEMKVKFSLSFDVVDRAETHAVQKRLGLDANPWRTFPRIITSYHYLRQPDVLEQFRATCAQPEGSAQLPWDLLIVDEAHNLMPSNFGEDSDLSKMLRAIAPWFEHKLFLSATPHNGHTRCFSGLLEQLDPIRFTQSSKFTNAMRQRIEQVVVRRQNFIQTRNGRPVYRPTKDTALLHLGHPLFHQALNLFARARFPGGGLDEYPCSRWIVRYGEVPAGADALLLLTVEELAVNDLRKPFHHWVRTVRLLIQDEELGKPLPHVPAGIERELRVGHRESNASATLDSRLTTTEPAAISRAQELWEDISQDVRASLAKMATDLTNQLKARLKLAGQAAQQQEKERFRQRLQEVERAMRETTIQKIEKERDELLSDMQQLSLIPDERRAQEERLRDLDEELRRRKGHYQDLLDQLKREQMRVLEGILPKRFSLRGTAQVFPVTVEIRLPEVRS